MIKTKKTKLSKKIKLSKKTKLSKNNKKFNTYIMHYTPLVERKTHIINEMKKHNINNYIFIEDYDKEVLTDTELQLFDLNKVRMSEISLAMKHIETWKRIINSNYEYGLIFEDDIVLQNGFSNKLKNYIEQLPEDFDMCFIGECANLHIPDIILKDKKGVNIFKKENSSVWWGGTGAGRCLDSYLISKKCCIKIFKLLFYVLIDNTINYPIDLYMNEMSRILELNVYWAEPTIVKQGTETGLFKSAIK
jgi:glycosyl transferase family 25